MVAEKLSQLAEEIAQAAKAQVFALRVDCADARSVREAFEGVLSLGPVEVLVYNACEPPAANEDARPVPFLAVTPDAFHRALAVSAGGAFHCAQQVRAVRTSSSSLHTQTQHSAYIPISLSLVTARAALRCVACRRIAGHPGHGGEGQGHHHLHGLLGVGHRLRRLLRSK